VFGSSGLSAGDLYRIKEEDAVLKIFFKSRLLAAAFVLSLAVTIATLGAAVSVFAQQANPNAATSEQQMLQQLKIIQGRGTIPDTKSYVLEQPAGRDWREFRTVWLQWMGGVSIIGMLVLLAAFYTWRGSIPIEEGRSGRKVLRFTGFERFVHWLTATSFVVLAITGLNVTFGRGIILPWLGLESFSAWSEWAKYAHNYVAFAFTLGVVLMFLMWIGQNFPTSADMTWLKMGGGMFTRKGGPHAPAYKFNAGQKLLYWLIVLGGVAMIVSGFILLFPFYAGLNVDNMQVSAIFHGVVGMLFIALILGHIYLGTLGMEGAFESMAEGTVDYNWAKEHHQLWLEEESRRSRGAPLVTPTPAE
jgi:formate dehydrogenase subunit gamma